MPGGDRIRSTRGLCKVLRAESLGRESMQEADHIWVAKQRAGDVASGRGQAHGSSRLRPELGHAAFLWFVLPALFIPAVAVVGDAALLTIFSKLR